MILQDTPPGTMTDRELGELVALHSMRQLLEYCKDFRGRSRIRHLTRLVNRYGLAERARFCEQNHAGTQEAHIRCAQAIVDANHPPPETGLNAAIKAAREVLGDGPRR